MSLSRQKPFIYPINKKTDSILIIKVTKYEKKALISYAFIQSLVTKYLVPFSKRILTTNFSTSFEHVQYNE